MPIDLKKSVTKKKEKNTNLRNRKLRKKKYTSQKITRNTSTQKGGADEGGSKPLPPPTKKKMLVTGLEVEDIDLDALILQSAGEYTSKYDESIIQPVRDFLNTTQLQYFEEEKKYNPTIETDINFYTITGTSDITMDSLKKIETTPQKEIVLLSLHGSLKKEEMTKRLPHNVMVCHLSEINTFNYIVEKEAFFIEKFLLKITKEQLESLFLHRTLHSTPENFKIYDQDLIKGTFNINYMIECLKKAQWYFPNQLYYDIDLEADDKTSNKLLHYYFDEKKKLKLKQTPYADKDKTSLSEICQILNGFNPNKMYLIFNTSCQPFLYEADKQEEEQKILNKLFIYSAVMYQLNLKIDKHLHGDLQKKKNKKIIPLEKKGKVPFCQDINSRFGSLYVPTDFDHNYYAMVKQVKDKTDNLHRKFPFFYHIEKEMEEKKLKKKDINRFAVFFLGLSLNKKIKYYFRLLNNLNMKPKSIFEKNFQALLKKISEDRFFILNFLQMLDILESKYMFKYSEAIQQDLGSILDEDVDQFLFLVNLIFTSRGLESTYQLTLLRRIQTTFLGKYDNTVQFYFRHFKNPTLLEDSSPNHTKKKLSLFQTHINQKTDISTTRVFPNLEEIEFRKINVQQGLGEVTYQVNPKIKKVDIRFVTEPRIKFKFYKVPGAYANLTYLLLEDCKLNEGLFLEGIPLEKLYLLKIKELKMLHLKKLNKIEELNIHLVEPCMMSFQDVKVDAFDIECSDTAQLDFKYKLSWQFQGFHINSVNIKEHLIMGLFLRNIISTAVPINNINYRGFLGDTLTPEERNPDEEGVIPKLAELITASTSFGLTTTFSLPKMLNYKISKRLPTHIQEGKHIKELHFKVV